MKHLQLPHWVLASCALAASLAMLPAHAADRAPKATLDAVVVSQGGAELTLGEVDAYARSVPEKHREGLFASPKRVGSILRNLLLTQQLAAEARAMGLQDSARVQARIRMKTTGILAQARKRVLRESLRKHIPDMTALAHERYLANPKQFTLPRRVDVKHILVSTKERSDAEARALAEKVYKQLQADPSQFSAFVEKYSDASQKAKNHGVIRNATSDAYVQPFQEAAAKLEAVGDIIGPVKTRYGYHILKAIAITPADQRTFAEVKPKLVKKLRKDWVAEQVNHHIDALRSKKLDANPELVMSLQARYAQPDDNKPQPAGTDVAADAQAGGAAASGR